MYINGGGILLTGEVDCSSSVISLYGVNLLFGGGIWISFLSNEKISYISFDNFIKVSFVISSVISIISSCNCCFSFIVGFVSCGISGGSSNSWKSFQSSSSLLSSGGWFSVFFALIHVLFGLLSDFVGLFSTFFGLLRTCSSYLRAFSDFSG